MKKQFVILTIFLCTFFLILNNYVIAQLTQKQLEAFRSAKTVLVVVEPATGDVKSTSLPFEKLTQRLLKYAGLNVVRTNAAAYDLKLMIKPHGRAISEEYSDSRYAGFSAKRTLYTGADLSGSISLEIPGIPVYEKSFRGRIEPPNNIKASTIYYQNPDAAPFQRAFNVSFVQEIIEMLGEVYNVSAALKHEDKVVRRYVAEALGKTGDSRAVESLITALKDEDEDVRLYAVGALGKIGDSQAVEPLITALKDEEWKVREKAAEVLGKIGDSRAVEPLITALKDKYSIFYEKHVIEALGNIGDFRAVEALITVMKDVGYGRGYAAKALGKITGKNFGVNHKKWMKWWKKNKAKFIKDN